MWQKILQLGPAAGSRGLIWIGKRKYGEETAETGEEIFRVAG
jgi:hypothetical protein